MSTNEIEFQISVEVDENKNKAKTRETLRELESSLRQNKYVESVKHIEKKITDVETKGAELIALGVVVLPSLISSFFLLLNTKIQSDKNNPIKVSIKSGDIEINIEYDRARMSPSELEVEFQRAMDKFEMVRNQPPNRN